MSKRSELQLMMLETKKNYVVRRRRMLSIKLL